METVQQRSGPRERGGDSSLRKESGIEPDTKIISTFHSRQRTVRGKKETSSNSTVALNKRDIVRFPCGPWSSPDPSRAPQPPRSLCLWHRLCVKQNWVIPPSFYESLLLMLYWRPYAIQSWSSASFQPGVERNSVYSTNAPK